MLTSKYLVSNHGIPLSSVNSLLFITAIIRDPLSHLIRTIDVIESRLPHMQRVATFTIITPLTG